MNTPKPTANVALTKDQIQWILNVIDKDGPGSFEHNDAMVELCRAYSDLEDAEIEKRNGGRL